MMWQDQTQISYFGIGPNSLQSEREPVPDAEHRYRGYATLRPVPSLVAHG